MPPLFFVQYCSALRCLGLFRIVHHSSFFILHSSLFILHSSFFTLLLPYPLILKALRLEFLTLVDVPAIEDEVAPHRLSDNLP